MTEIEAESYYFGVGKIERDQVCRFPAGHGGMSRDVCGPDHRGAGGWGMTIGTACLSHRKDLHHSRPFRE
jgi:hypothetical protein